MVHTDGNPTIAWADAYRTDPIYKILELVRDRYEDGTYKWQPCGGAPVPRGSGLFHKYHSCIGMAACYTAVDGEVLSNPYDNPYGYEAESYIKTAFRNRFKHSNQTDNLYTWNDALDPKSAKRSILRMLNDALKLRKKQLELS